MFDVFKILSCFMKMRTKFLIFLQSYDQKRCKILNFLRWIKYWAKVYIKIMPKHQHNHIKSRLSLRARVKICSGCQKLHKNFGYTEYFTAQTCRSFLGGMGKCGTSETERANFYGTKNTWIVMWRPFLPGITGWTQRVWSLYLSPKGLYHCIRGWIKLDSGS